VVESLQTTERAALAAPGAVRGFEDFGLGRNQHLLLLRCQLHHAEPRIRIAQRGENLALHPEIRVALMRSGHRIRQAQRNLPEFLRRHAGFAARFAQSASLTRTVEAGCLASIQAGRIGRGAKPPPQLGQTPAKTVSAQSAQNVHS
jgi:hypothetical protein